MLLNHEEQVIRVYHHHPFPFMLQILKVLLLTIPFYFIAFVVAPSFSFAGNLIIFGVITAIFLSVIIYLALIYWLDRLIITNRRIIHENWKYLTVKDEDEAFLHDILDIHTKEKGIFSIIPLFDYGTFRVETASQNTTLLFDEAPNPEGIKSFLYLYQQIRMYGYAIKKVVDIPFYA